MPVAQPLSIVAPTSAPALSEAARAATGAPSLVLVRVALGAAVVAGWVLWRRRPEHRPAAVALTALAALDVAHTALRGWGPRLVDDAAFLAAYAVQVTLALRVFLPPPPPAPSPRRLPLWAALPAAGLVAALVAIAAGAARRGVYAIAFDASLALQVVAVAVYVRGRRSKRGREEPASEHGVAALLAASAVADAVGPWRWAHPQSDWGEGVWTALLTWAMVAVWEVWQWLVSSPRVSS